MKKVLIVAFVAMMLLAGCDLFTAMEYNTNITINGKVTDQTGAPVPAAMVVLTGFSGSATTTTDQYGIYNFKGVKAGTYTLSFTKTGYARVNSSQVDINNASSLVPDLNLTEYEYTKNLDVVMYETSAILTGSVFYGDSTNRRPATGAKVVAYLGLPSIAEEQESRSLLSSTDSWLAEVQEDGTFSFNPGNTIPNGLPRAADIRVFVERWNDGAIVYEGSELPGSPFSFITSAGTIAASFTMAPAFSDPLVLTTGLGTTFIPSTGTISLAFSRAVAPHDCSFRLVDDPLSVEPVVVQLIPVWAADNLSVLLKLSEELALGATYFLDYAVADTAGYSTSDASLSLRTISAIALLQTNTDASNTGTAVIDVDGDLSFHFNVNIARIKDISLTSGQDAEVRGFSTVIDGTTVTINPATDLKPALSYTIKFEAISDSLTDEADSTLVTRTFNSNGTASLLAVSNFRLSPSTPTADYNTTALTFLFTEVANAKRYDLFARYYQAGENLKEWHQVGTTPTTFKDYYDPVTLLNTSISADLSSNPYFDRYADDQPLITPWVNSQKIEFKLLAVDLYGNTSTALLKTSSGTIQDYVEDTVLPSSPALTVQTGGPLIATTLATAQTVSFLVQPSEYIQLPTASNLTLTSFTDSHLILPGAFTWSTSGVPLNFTFELTFPLGFVIESGNIVQIRVRDLSGNQSDPISFTVP